MACLHLFCSLYAGTTRVMSTNGGEVMEGNGCRFSVFGSMKLFSESARCRSGSLFVVSLRNTYSCTQREEQQLHIHFCCHLGLLTASATKLRNSHHFTAYDFLSTDYKADIFFLEIRVEACVNAGELRCLSTVDNMFPLGTRIP